MEKELHVILGTGPVGCWTARSLVDQGLTVRAVNRSGNRPELMPAEVELRAADVSDAGQAIAAAQGATTIYQALSPAYHQWHELFPGLQAGALVAAKATGAVYVSIENLYMYDSSGVMTEDTRIAPVSKKVTLRQRMAEEVMAAHQRGEIRAVALRSSDYYGPGVTSSALGDMVFGNLAAGNKARVSGSLEQPHSFAYIEDVGRTAAELGIRDDALGRIWIAPHASAQTQGKMVAAACASLGIPMRVKVVSPFAMRVAGLFIRGARESVEMMYEFTRPFVVDSGRVERERPAMASKNARRRCALPCRSVARQRSASRADSCGRSTLSWDASGSSTPSRDGPAGSGRRAAREVVMAYSIREYGADDLDGVMSSWEHANELAHSFLPEEFVSKVRHDIPSLYLPNAETWVAEDGCNGRVVGFIALIGNEIGAIFVEPEFHGAGIGRALVDKAREVRGDLEVEVFELNAIGRRFYSRYGFRPMSETTHEDTGNKVLRLTLPANQSLSADREAGAS